MRDLKTAKDFMNGDEYYDLQDVEDYYEQNNIEYPRNPSEPRLSSTKPSKEELEKYLRDVENFPIFLKEYQELKKDYDEYQSFKSNQIREFIFDYVNINSIPEIYREKVISYADSRSDNYYDLKNKLADIISYIFN